MLLARYDDHLSFYALERIFRERHAVEIPRQQMVQWVEHIAGWLRPIYDAMWQEMKAGGYVQIDETPVKVLDPEVKGKAAQGYLWFFAVAPRRRDPGVFPQPRPAGAAPAPARFRGHDPDRCLRGLSGLGAERRGPGTHRVPRARAPGVLSGAEGIGAARRFGSSRQIRQLYRLEDQLRSLDPAARYRLRQEQAPPIWDAMKQHAEDLQPKLLPKSTLGKAVNYFLNEYHALLGYLHDGRFEIDNNLIENDIRPTAVGRKRWLFIGHPQAGWRSAVIYSVLHQLPAAWAEPAGISH